VYRKSAPEVPAAERLIYRNGFVFSTTPVFGYPFESWTAYQLGDFILRVHPDATCVVQTHGKAASALLGDAFDPERGIYNRARVLKSLLDATTVQDFNQTLDRLAGRFVLFLAHPEGGYELFQDAIGSRTVFYAETRAMAASHAEILARSLGSGINDFFIPFLTSRNYVSKATKYLPGVTTPFEHVLQLTPNTKLLLPEQKVARFWPRASSETVSTDETALEALIVHVTGLLEYFRVNDLEPAIGLTAGTDSRLLFAAFRSSNPYLFTYIRSGSGTNQIDVDTKQAAVLAETYGLTREIYPITIKPTLSEASDAFSYAYRRSTSYLRGSTSQWINKLAAKRFGTSTRFIRGFGGEILRGYYQEKRNRIRAVDERQLANAYDINAGSFITRELFRQFMVTASFDEGSLHGRDPNDIFYWEHRMGIWGSTSMAEADLAVPSLVGYNSRNLYETFLTLPWESRKARTAFHQATQRLAPLLPTGSP
jgi:hypothetical protein